MCWIYRTIATELTQRKIPGAGPLRWGFHAVPSLDVLHLHIVSQEFDSASMKKHKQWHR